MRVQRVTAATVLVVGMGLVAVATPSQAALTTFCDGAASDVTVPGHLVVRAGDSCELTNVTIDGDATVRADANLILTDATVNGNVVVRSNGFTSVIGGSVAGNTRLNDAFGGYTESTELAGAVNASQSGFYYSLDTIHDGNVNSTDGETFLESGWLTGNLATSGDLLTDVYDTVIERSLDVSAAQRGAVVCASEIDGAATFDGNADLVQIGAGTVADCAFNVFGAGVTITGTTGESFVTGNVVRGDLTCSDNEPAPVVSDNRIRGVTDCDGPAAAMTRSGAEIDADARRAGVRAAIDERMDVGKDAADGAGYAFD